MITVPSLLLLASILVAVFGGLLWTVSDELSLLWKFDGGQRTTQFTLTGTGGKVIVDEAIQGNTVDNQISQIVFTQSKLKKIILFAPDSGKDIIFYTNDTFGGSPQDSFTIKGGGPPFTWFYGSGIPNPFADNVTSARTKNAGANNTFNTTLIGEITLDT